MALSPSKSAEYTLFTTAPQRMVSSARWGSKLRASSASLTFTAAGQGTAKMLRLPAGAVRVLVDLCRIVCPQGTASADLHVGFASYKQPDGTVVAADADAFAANLDIGAAAIDQAFPLPAVGYLDLESQDGVDIEITIDTANGPAAGEAWLLVVYQMGN